MKKFSKKIAKIGIVLCSILLVFSIVANNAQSVKFYALLCVVNLVTLFLDRIMNDIQKVLDKVYNYINK